MTLVGRNGQREVQSFQPLFSVGDTVAAVHFATPRCTFSPANFSKTISHFAKNGHFCICLVIA